MAEAAAGRDPGEGRRPRALAAGMLLTLGLWLTWQILAQGLAAHFERTRPALALALAGRDPVALARLAEAKLGEGDAAAAGKLAARALAQAPLDVRALRVLGMSWVASGAERRGGELLAFAAARSWRDGPTHGWLLKEAVRRGAAGEALTHADALLRRSSEAREPVFEFMSIAVGASAWADAVGDSVAQNPPWRTDFLAHMARRARSEAGVARVFQAAEAGRWPLTKTELGGYLNRHFAARQPRQARAALVALRRLENAGVFVFDGGFDRTDGVEPFTWTPQERIGVRLDWRDSPTGGAGRALRVEYDGYSSIRLLRQMTVLPPGEYLISGRTFAETGAAGRLRWRLECLPDGQRLADLPEPALPAVGAWRPIRASFRVPDGCEAQWLTLVGAPGDRRTTIVRWYDDLSIEDASGPGQAATERPSSPR